MNIFEALEKTNFSTSEKILRDLIMKDPKGFASLRTETIAKNYHVSRATIYRLCEKLEVDGISDLKVRILTDLDSWNASKQDFDYNYPVKEGVSSQKIADNMEKDYNQTILSTKNLLDNTVLRTASAKMEKAKQIDIYTSAGNIYFADNFAFQMKEIGKTVNVPHELYLQTLYASSSDPSHFAIVISYGGRSRQMEKICRTLKENQTEFLLICSQEAQRLIPYASMCLYFSSLEDHYQKISSFSTRVSLLYILDVLYTCYFERDYEKNVKNKTEFYKKLAGI